MYKHKLIFTSNVFELGMTNPAGIDSGSVIVKATASTAVRAAGAPGRLAATITAADASVALESGSIMTMELLECATVDGSFVAPVPNIVQTMTLGAGVNLAPDTDEVIMTMIIPQGILDNEPMKWIKVKIGSDDENAAGTLNVFLEYLAN